MNRSGDASQHVASTTQKTSHTFFNFDLYSERRQRFFDENVSATRRANLTQYDLSSQNGILQHNSKFVYEELVTVAPAPPATHISHIEPVELEPGMTTHEMTLRHLSFASWIEQVHHFHNHQVEQERRAREQALLLQQEKEHCSTLGKRTRPSGLHAQKMLDSASNMPSKRPKSSSMPSASRVYMDFVPLHFSQSNSDTALVAPLALKPSQHMQIENLTWNYHYQTSPKSSRPKKQHKVAQKKLDFELTPAMLSHFPAVDLPPLLQLSPDAHVPIDFSSFTAMEVSQVEEWGQASFRSPSQDSPKAANEDAEKSYTFAPDTLYSSLDEGDQALPRHYHSDQKFDYTASEKELGSEAEAETRGTTSFAFQQETLYFLHSPRNS